MDPQTQPIQVSQSKPFLFLPVLLSFLVLLLAITTGYLSYRNIQLTKQLGELQQPIPSPTPISAQTPTPTTIDPTINWKSYTNQTLGFTLKYPNDYHMLTENPVVSFGFGIGVEAPSPYLTISNFYTATAPASGSTDIVIDNTAAKSFYTSNYHVVQTITKPFELKMYVAGGGLDSTFSHILSTFKFTDQSPTPTCIPLPDCAYNQNTDAVCKIGDKPPSGGTWCK